MNLHRILLLALLTLLPVAGTSLASPACSCDRTIENSELKPYREIIDTNEVAGWTREEVHLRFGSPSDGKTFVGWDEGYYLRPDASCVDSEWFVLRYGADGHVANTGLYHD